MHCENLERRRYRGILQRFGDKPRKGAARNLCNVRGLRKSGMATEDERQKERGCETNTVSRVGYRVFMKMMIARSLIHSSAICPIIVFLFVPNAIHHPITDP